MAQDVRVEGPTAVSLQVNFLKARLKSLFVSYPAQYIDFRTATGDKAAVALGVWLLCLPKIYCCGLWEII